MITVNSPSQVTASHAITDAPKHENNERERRKQHARRRGQNKNGSPIDRRTAHDRRKPSFQARA
ncbi:hypothetical protein A9Q78_07540 [Methylophaga sp. 41_12_T18]|nr:hypothetical protein A9Q78_07540 [Methylophaga sp. 41_12_T18]